MLSLDPKVKKIVVGVRKENTQRKDQALVDMPNGCCCYGCGCYARQRLDKAPVEIR